MPNLIQQLIEDPSEQAPIAEVAFPKPFSVGKLIAAMSELLTGAGVCVACTT